MKRMKVTKNFIDIHCNAMYPAPKQIKTNKFDLITKDVGFDEKLNGYVYAVKDDKKIKMQDLIEAFDRVLYIYKDNLLVEYRVVQNSRERKVEIGYVEIDAFNRKIIILHNDFGPALRIEKHIGTPNYYYEDQYYLNGVLYSEEKFFEHKKEIDKEIKLHDFHVGMLN